MTPLAWIRRAGLAMALPLVLGAAGAPPAKPPAPGPLAGWVATVRAQHPALAAARRRWEAAIARAGGEGLLPDPMLEAGMMNLIGLEGPQVAVTQMLPGGAKRELARRQAENEAEVARQAYRAEVAELLATVRTTYYGLYAVTREAELTGTSRALARRMAKLAADRYAVGVGKQADAVRANVRVAEMLRDAVVLAGREAALRARLATLLGTSGAPPVDRRLPVPPVEAPASPGPAIAALDRQSPVLAGARAELAMAETGLLVARTVTTPDLTARLGVGRAFMDRGWQTAVSGMVGVTLPYPQAERRETAAVGAAEATASAGRDAVEATRRRLVGRAHELTAALAQLHEQVALAQGGMLRQARQALAAEVANYTVGKADIDAVLGSQLALLATERELYRAIAEYHTARAELDALVGTDVAEPPANPTSDRGTRS